MSGKNKKIFISIAACEERFLEQTVKSALIKAKYPDNIYFGIYNNILNRNHSLLDNDFFTKNKHIFYTEVVSPSPLGVGFGRSNASTLQFHDFDYMFQIDAHTLFTKDWDEQIIEAFEQIKNETGIDENKIILTGITPIMWSYNENDLDTILFPDTPNKRWIKSGPYDFEEIFLGKIKEGLIVPRLVFDGMQGGVYTKFDVGFPIVYGGGKRTDSDYQEVNCVHASFVFSKANLNRDVLHDPEDFWSGDQTNFSIRLLSRGYKIFCPKYPVIATLNKSLPKDDDWTNFSIDLDEEYNWRTYGELYENGRIYRDQKLKDDREFYSDIVNGEYFGYWGAPDLQSLNEAKRKMGIE